jgi:thiol-disulfide isomerase/thioredoxin
MKQFLTLLFLLGGLLSCTQQQQEKMNTIHIEFEGIRYDSLELVLWLDDWNRESIRGHSEDGYRWEFSYPDSIYDRQYYSWFRVLGTPDTVRHTVGFFNLVQQEGDTIRAFGGIFGRPKSFIKARYIETKTFFNDRWINVETDDVIFGTSITDEFEVFTEDKDFISTMKGKHGNYGMMWSRTLTYEEMVQRDMEFIRQYPNSQSMIHSLHSNRVRYRSKDDIAKKFNLFSKELQQSFYGRKIHRYITFDNTVFRNQMLTTWDTDILEPIIQDSSKFNLVLFSASWCQPCIRQIPIVKEIYKDLGQKLIITYVSIDEERTVENWREKMRTHEIPWRSLMVLTREKSRAIHDDYEVPGVPSAVLVHPNTMKVERLNLWQEEARQRLYQLLR